jgi:hypothetical protein
MVSYRQKSSVTSRLALRMLQVWVLTLDFMTGPRLRSTTMTTNKAGASYRVGTGGGLHRDHGGTLTLMLILREG